MAVFTPITLAQLTSWLEQFALGKVVDYCDISAGIENSNFFITVAEEQQYKKYVLTLFERLSETELPFYLYLMRHLAARGMPVPDPISNKDGKILGNLNGKPAVLVNCLPGHSISTPNIEHCKQVGAMLAQLHLAGKDYALKQENLRSLTWWEKTIPHVLPYLSSKQRVLINAELAFQQQFFASADYSLLPAGPSHCDLFRDNVFFSSNNGQDQLSGIFDFYFAGCDKWLFDLAVTVNDWCMNQATLTLDPILAKALLKAYHAIRPLSNLEKNCWSSMLRAAALRFWVSRLWDFYLPRQAKTLKPHDPQYFEKILYQHIQTKTSPWIN